MNDSQPGPYDDSSDLTVRADGANGVDDPRVYTALAEYMAELEAGRRPHRREFLARFPEIADQLAVCIDGLAMVHSAAAGVRPDAAAPAPQPHLAAGEPLGDFRLIREIGRGGMGIVYEAVQLTLGRRVALKVLPFAAALDPRHLERFRNEAQAAAQLHHTNIVPVYAVGCERSVHFYAMQLIEGQSLSEVIRDLREFARPTVRLAASGTSGRSDETLPYPTPSNRGVAAAASHTPWESGSFTPTSAASVPSANSLSTLRSSKGAAYARSVATLGLQVAEALDYAHRGGIVHRDIKPANLLLDARGTIWITDFGLAQFYTQSDLTRTGDLVGTLRYMSPEQASGRAVVLDQRTDIYSLGVTLFELLTLERALTGQTHEQLLLQLANDEPRPARTIDKTIPRELETVLLKAMARDPVDRYATARAMAEDLRRFLQDEPILARPPTLFDKTWKWVRRHKAWAAAGVVVLTLSTAALLVSTLAIAREQSNTRRAYQSEQAKVIEARRERLRAERSWAQARDAVDFFSTVAIGMDRPQFSEVRRDLLEESLAYYQQFVEERRGDTSVAGELASAEARVTSYLDLYAALDASVRAENRLALLREPSVREDLGLTPAQITAAESLVAELGSGGMPRTGADDRVAKDDTDSRRLHVAARAREIDAGISRVLGPQAADRLCQISRQMRGPAAFSDPDVVEKLELAREQRSRIRAAQVAYRNMHNGPGRGGPGESDLRPHGGMPDHPNSGGGPAPDASFGDKHGPAAAQSASDATAPIVQLLTPMQAATWATLIGTPFRGTFGTHGPGMRDDRGPRSPGNGGGGGPWRDTAREPRHDLSDTPPPSERHSD